MDKEKGRVIILSRNEGVFLWVVEIFNMSAYAVHQLL